MNNAIEKYREEYQKFILTKKGRRWLNYMYYNEHKSGSLHDYVKYFCKNN